MSDTVPFRDIRRMLEENGWALDRISGSHHIFAGPDRPMIVIAVHKGKSKRVYDRTAKKAIEALKGGSPQP